MNNYSFTCQTSAMGEIAWKVLKIAQVCAAIFAVFSCSYVLFVEI